MAGPVPPPTHPLLPLPRRPLARESRASQEGGGGGDDVRGWYENELGWATVPGHPVRLLTGERFDVLDVPAAAGHAALRRLTAATAATAAATTTPAGFPVSLHGRSASPHGHAADGVRMRLLVAAGAAEELPGILQWLEWGALPLDLTAIGAGGFMEAPPPPAFRRPPRARPLQGAAEWVRPPVAGCEVESSLPTMSALGAPGGAPDLVRLVNTLATECHRVRLRRACAQPLAFS
ncbi:SCO3374 family protein [Streptomyces antibioticus]|uniref:SCO3374 family protein n=1 Tax=Streptomyces antibioticus TaxID=1890 RepID=UPI00367EFAE7